MSVVRAGGRGFPRHGFGVWWGPVLTREAEEREEGEEACRGHSCGRDRAIRSRLRAAARGKGCGTWGRGWDTPTWGISAPVCWGKLGPQGKMGSPASLPRGSAPQLSDAALAEH